MRNGYKLLLALVVIILVDCTSRNEKLTMLYWNDFHSFNVPYESRLKDNNRVMLGGSATLKGYINKFKNENKNVATVHAGDEFQGTPICSITKGMSQVKLLNIIQPDVFTLGNHEFDYGREALVKALSQARFPVISANIFDTEQGKPFVEPYFIKQYGNLKIGYIGLMTPYLKSLSLPEHVRDFKIIDPVKAARQYINQIKDSVDLIVIVSHMGVRQDSLLAEEVEGIDVIIGGHLHKALFDPMVVNDVIICQAGSQGKFLGRLELEFDKKKMKIVRFHSQLFPTIVDQVQPDPIVAAAVDSLEKIAGEQLDVVIGELKMDWIRSRNGESNVGNWQTDVMRGFAGTDIAFQNSGGIRKNIFAGKITLRDMWELNPFANYFITFELTGNELKKTLERNSSGSGEFLQISGVKYKWNPNKPTGQRVFNIMVNAKPLIESKTYSVCTNNFLIEHFYNVFGFPRGDRAMKELNVIDRDIFIDAVKKQQLITSRIEGRIIEIK